MRTMSSTTALRVTSPFGSPLVIDLVRSTRMSQATLSCAGLKAVKVALSVMLGVTQRTLTLSTRGRLRGSEGRRSQRTCLGSRVQEQLANRSSAWADGVTNEHARRKLSGRKALATNPRRNIELLPRKSVALRY